MYKSGIDWHHHETLLRCFCFLHFILWWNCFFWEHCCVFVFKAHHFTLQGAVFVFFSLPVEAEMVVFFVFALHIVSK